MKEFNLKKYLAENKLLKEDKLPTKLSTWYTVPGGSVYKVVVTFDDGSTEKFRTEDEAEKKYDLSGVEREESEFDVSESLNEVKSGDIVTYKGEDHTVMSIEDDDLGVRIYIRPNEESYYLGKKDTFWVKPEDLNEVDVSESLNEIESGDVVVYNHDDHTVMRIEDDELGKRIYIRPNEKSYYGGRKDTFWVKPTDIETKEEFMDRMMKDQIEHDEETLRRERGLEEIAGTFGDGVTKETKKKYVEKTKELYKKAEVKSDDFNQLGIEDKQKVIAAVTGPKLKDILSKSSSLIGRQGTRNFMDEAENRINEVVKGNDFRFIEIKDLHFETDPDRLEDMKVAFGAKMGGVTSREMIEDAEYELRRFRKEIGYGDGTSTDPFLPGTYDAVTSKLGDGPHAKKVSTPKWNERKYEQWIEDVASGGGAKFAYDMAQNAKMEAGLIDWVKKNRLGFGDVTPLERIQYDIEALAESINEVTQKQIDDIENSGNIDIAYKKAMKLLNSLKEKSVNEGLEGTPQYYVKYTTEDGKTAKYDAENKIDAIKKEKELVKNGADEEKVSVWKIQDHVDLNGKPYTIDTELDKEIDYRKDEKGRPINEGTCGYTPDGKPRSKPASPELMEDDINLNIDYNDPKALDDEVNHMFEEDLVENKDERLAIMLDENGKFIIGMATDKHARSKEAGPFNTQKEACKFYSNKKETLLKNLTENNRLDEFLSNKYQIIGDIDSTCAIDESKEFNFNKMVKEALTPNILK